MLLEFSHRYTAQVLVDAQVYAEHAGRPGKITTDDVTLAIQAKVGFEFGGRVPKEYLLMQAASVNAEPLPPVSEVFGVRLPAPEHCLIQPDIELIPNPPPMEDPLYKDVEEDVTDDDDDDEEDEAEEEFEDQADVEMMDTAAVTNGHEDLFDGEDDDDGADSSKAQKRDLVEDDEYD